MTKVFQTPTGLVRAVTAGIAALALVACDNVPQSERPGALEPGVFAPTREGPKDAPKGTCWGRTFSPAVVETVTSQVLVKPAQVNPDGTVTSLPEYRTEGRQVIVTPRKDNWFETPCPEVMTPEFTSSLQRALQARGTFGGEVTGVMDVSTRKAVELFQSRNIGLASTVLSLETARLLGLIAVPRAPSE